MIDRNKHNLLNHNNLASEKIFDGTAGISSRLIFQNKPAPQEQPKPAATDKPADLNAPKEEAKKPEVVDVSADAKKVVIDKMQTDIRLANANLKSVEAQLTPKAQEYLQNYFQSSIDRFDADKDGKISKDEAEKYKVAMFAKTKSLIDEYAPTEEQKKATEAKNAAAKAVEAPEISSKNIGEIKEISGTLDLQTSLAEFKSLQTQNNSFQSAISQSLQSISGFHTKVANFQKAQQGWKAFSHAANEIFHPFSESDGAKRERELKAKVDAAKDDEQSKLTDLKSKKTILDSNGEKIKAAIAVERKKMIDDRDAKIAEMKSAQTEQGEKIGEKKQKYDQIKKKQDDLIKQQQTLQDKQTKQAEFQKSWSEVKVNEQWENRQKAFVDSGKDATAEMEALKIILDDEHLTPEMKDKVQKEYDAVASRQKSSETNLNLVTERIKNGKNIDRQLTEDEKANLDQINSVTGYLKGQVEPALASTTTTIAKLEELKIQYATQSTEVADYFNKKVEQMDEINESVSNNTLASAVGRDKSINALESAVKSLDSLDIDNRGIARSILRLPQGFLHGVGESCHDISGWFDKNMGFILDSTDGGWHVLAQFLGAFAGFASGGIELVGGVYTMFAHPWETAKGITALVGVDANNGTWTTDTFWATWKHLGSALVGGDEWEKGHYGTSAGKFVFNALSMFVGAGEVKAAGEAGVVGRAASAASKARLAKVAEALAKGATETPWMLGRGAQILEFAKTLAIEATPKFVKNAAAAGAEEVGFISKTGAVLRSLGGSIAKATPEFLKGAWKKGVDAKGVLGKPLAVAKSLAWSGVKGIGNVLVFTGKIYKELLMSPVSAVRATARFVRELPGLARRIGSEGMVNVFRASKLSEAAQVIAAESGNFAKAREAIADIISKDEKLLQLSQEGEVGSLERAAGAKAAEAQASIKLLRENPKLFDSYIKMEDATAKLNEYGTKMTEDIKSNIKKVKENPEVAFEVAEHNQLKDQYDAAKAKLDKTPKPNAAPAKLEVKVTDADQIAKIDQYMERTAGQHGWNAAQRAEVRDAMLASEDLSKAPKGNPFAQKMDAVANEYIYGKTPFQGGAVVDAKAYAAAETEFTKAKDTLSSFEKDRRHMDKVDSHYKAVQAEDELADLLGERKQLLDKYVGAPKKPLANLEAEVGEARAVKENRITATTDTPEFIDKARADFEAAAKSGNAAELEKATSAFGTVEANSELGKTLDAIKRKVKGEKFDAALADADLRTVFQRNQTQLLEDYQLYNKAIQADLKATDRFGADQIATKKALREKHPAWKEAFDEMDLRQNYLLENGVITHKISAVRIKVELPEIIKPGMKAEEAASILRKRYAGQKMGADAIGAPAGEFALQGKTYKVVLEGNAEVRVIAPDGSTVRTLEEIAAEAKAAKAGKVSPEAAAPKASPVGEPIPAELKLKQEALAKLEQDLAAAKASDQAVAELQARFDVASAEFKAATAPTTTLDLAPQLRDKINNAKQREIVKVGGSEYRYDSRQGWQEKTPGKAWFETTVDEGTYLKQNELLDKAVGDLQAKFDVAKTELRDKINKPNNREIVTVGGSEYRYDSSRGWQERSPGKAWFDTAADEGTYLKQNELLDKGIAELQAKFAPTAVPVPAADIAIMEGKLTTLKTELEAAKETASGSPTIAAIERRIAFEAEVAAAPEVAAETAIAKPAEAGAVEAKAAKGGPNKSESYKRYKDADKLLEESKGKLDTDRKALRDQEQNLKTAQGAYDLREAAGKTESLPGLKTKIEAQKKSIGETKSSVTELEEIVSTARKKYWSARAEVAGENAVNYITSPLRSKWLENTVERLRKIKGIPGEIGEALATFLKEQAASKYASIRLLSEKGLGIARKLNYYWNKTHDQTRPLSRLYNEILDDQLILLSQLSKSVARNLEEFKGLAAGEKIAKVEAGWNQLALGGGGISKEEMYSEAEIDYLKDKKLSVQGSIDGLRDQEGITPTDVQAAIDTKLGPEGNDVNKSYTINVDGITVKVDQDGHRTYEGLEKWVADTPNKKLVGEAFSEVASDYNSLDAKSALQLNGGKAYASPAELKKQVEGKLKNQILEKIKGQDLQGGLTVFSKGRISPDEPNFVAQITETGKITLDINDKWVQQIYDQASGKIKPPEGTEAPIAVPKAKKGPAKGPGKAAPDLVSKGEATEPDEVSASPVDASATYDKPKPIDDLPDPEDPYS